MLQSRSSRVTTPNASQRFSPSDDDQGDENKERVFFRQDQATKTEDIGGQARPVARRAQVFPEQAEAKERPKSEKTVDERMLGHVNLGRRQAHQRSDAQRPRGPFQTPAQKSWKATASGC